MAEPVAWAATATAAALFKDASATAASSLLTVVLKSLEEDEPSGPPPGTPPMQKFEGPWFTTQLIISSTLGLLAFMVFSYGRMRWPLLFAPRTKLKGFSPHEAHSHSALFGWIMPTLRTSEFTVLQIVGLDAAVLLNFFKMSFYLFSVCSLFAVTILMPLNWKHNKDLEDEDDWPSEGDDWPLLLSSSLGKLARNATFSKNSWDFPYNNNGTGRPDWLDLISDANSYLSVHLMFTYLFTLLALRFIYKNYRRFVRARQLFSLELVHSIPARTIMITNLPRHLQGERTLAEYFENMDLSVESVSLCRDVGSLKKLLDKRTKALLALERKWTEYVGNPSTVESYDPDGTLYGDTESGIGGSSFAHSQSDTSGRGQGRFVTPHKERPTLRPGWFKGKVDALEYLEEEFRKADEAVKERRRRGRFRAAGCAFVTFEKMSSAQIALQTAHAPSPNQMTTYPAPEPRDIVWANMTPPSSTLRTRDVFVLAVMALLLFFWIIPISALASLLSYKEIKKVMPRLGELIDSNDRIRAIVQNSLPSVAMIMLNALLPFILEALTYIQGYRARSWVEYSLLKKYFLFLLLSVIFIFLVATTYWQLVRDLAESPAKVPEKLALALQAGRARHFFLSYVILQGLGIVPLQLLNLGVIIPRFFSLMFITRTPRDFAELNAPPMINYGVVYPQAILMFVITLLYSVVQPLIVIFGAIYFGAAYIVYKYKLLFVFYKPYESQGQAWPITFIRLIWGIVIYLLFMIGIFTLRQSYIISSLLVPLLVFTMCCGWYIDSTFRPLSKFVSLSSVFEVQRGEETADVARLREGHPVTWSQSNLSRRRYAQNDDTLYVAPEDERTDYSQPPMRNWYSGVLNTGKRRYGHPALNGVLPEPWLPLKKGQSLVNHQHHNGRPVEDDGEQAVVLTLRKRQSKIRRGSRSRPPGGELNGNGGPGTAVPASPLTPHPEVVNTDLLLPPEAAVAAAAATRRPTPGRHTLSHRLSFDHATGVIMLDDHDDMAEETSADSSDVEYGNAGLLDQSVTESMFSSADTVGSGDEEDQQRGRAEAAPTRQSRYGTYFHHPERRRQPIPGAFPVR